MGSLSVAVTATLAKEPGKMSWAQIKQAHEHAEEAYIRGNAYNAFVALPLDNEEMNLRNLFREELRLREGFYRTEVEFLHL